MLRVTKTENGMVRGFPGTDARITVFKGIPFADDTSGENRWRAPQPAKNWEGVRDCYEFAPITMQKTPGLDQNAFYSKEWHVDPEVPMGEDSLALNIWTPAKSADEKLPVMIWIFGGALREGYAWEMEFDGERIAHRGVILVSIAYRLNCFGFMCHPDLTRDQPDAFANFGFLDQKAGIDWVRRNIANFGGDPDNITIFGQSAGGGSTLAHLCSPVARGSFKRAIVESAGGVAVSYPSNRAMRHYRTLEKAEADGVRFLRDYLNVETIEEARKLDAKFIEDKFLEMTANGEMWRGVVDGIYVPEQVDDTVLKGDVANVPIIIGNTNGEGRPAPADEEKAIAWVRDNFGEYADEYIDICRKKAEKEGTTLSKALSVNQNEVGAQVFADILAKQGRPIYYYVFGPEMPGDNAGAFHSSDLWFEFETLMRCWRPFTAKHYDLSRKMCNYWTNFAKTGDPNGNDADGTPMPEWKLYDAAKPCNIGFFDTVEFNPDSYDERARFLVDINVKAAAE
ncbi:MAG: carboxylesterase family protein [Oscillospiraceae bacterium]|nr:carboxylesterase family protein [Oscillospiraceae bacterium]